MHIYEHLHVYITYVLAKAFNCCTGIKVFLGFYSRKKGYKVMEMETKKIYESRDVIFYENIFRFQQ